MLGHKNVSILKEKLHYVIFFKEMGPDFFSLFRNKFKKKN